MTFVKVMKKQFTHFPAFYVHVSFNKKIFRMTICGIDYGNKLAGTTVIAWLDTAAQIISCHVRRRERMQMDLFYNLCQI
jgi:hypothetical protein